jgi:hypothetical protein
MNMSCKCEHEFWKAQPRRLPFADEPIAAVSGLIMCLLPLFDSAGLADPPLQFCLARASLVFCGLGTFVFHALGDEQMDALHLNGIIFDGVSMALVTVNVFLLHLTDAMKARPMVVSLACVFYLFFWIITNDLATFTYLQAVTTVNGVALISLAVQYPSFVFVYVYVLLKIAGRWPFSPPDARPSHWPMWTALVVSVVAWALNQFTCALWTGVFVGHTIWHIGIGYVAHYLIVLGVAKTYGYGQRREGLWGLLLLLEPRREFGAELTWDRSAKWMKDFL